MKMLFDFLPIILFFVVFKVKDIYWATATGIAATVLQVLWLLIRKKPVSFQLWLSLCLITVFGGLTILLHNPLLIMWKPTILYLSLSATLVFGWVVLRKNLIRTMLGDQIPMPESAWKGLNLAWIVFFAFLGILNLGVVYGLTGTYPVDRAALEHNKRSEVLEISLNRVAPDRIPALLADLAGTGFKAVNDRGTISVPLAVLGPGVSNYRAERPESLVRLVSPLAVRYGLKDSDVNARKNSILGTWVAFKLFGVLGLTLLFAVGQAVAISRYLKDGPKPSPD